MKTPKLTPAETQALTTLIAVLAKTATTTGDTARAAELVAWGESLAKTTTTDSSTTATTTDSSTTATTTDSSTTGTRTTDTVAQTLAAMGYTGPKL